MKFLKTNWNVNIILLILLILLNVIIRMTSIPHEMGNDSFTIHIMANSLSEVGFSRWWAHFVSIFGFYPYSYGSAVPFILSGISQSIGIQMEKSIWLFSVIIGLLSAFTAYILAGSINNNTLFKFLTAFSYSLSPGMLVFSTWDTSTRGLFIVLLPLYVYLLIKIFQCTTKKEVFKFCVLFFVVFILLMTTHKYFFMTIPIIIGFISFSILNKFNRYDLLKLPEYIIQIAFPVAFLIMLFIPFYTGIFVDGSRYGALISVLRNGIRYTGLLYFFAIFGLIYISFKRNKKLEEKLILFIILLLTPLIYNETYSHYFIIIFLCLLISNAILNVTRINIKKSYATYVLIIILLASVAFSAFYQHWRTDIENRRSDNVFYMTEPIYCTGLWIKDNMNADKRMVGYDELTGRRIFAISQIPTLVGDAPEAGYIYRFISIENISVHRNSPFSKYFYFNNPYVLNGIEETYQDFYTLKSNTIDSKSAKIIIAKYNLSYAIETKNYRIPFTQSLMSEKEAIYDNGITRIWNI